MFSQSQTACKPHDARREVTPATPIAAPSSGFRRIIVNPEAPKCPAGRYTENQVKQKSARTRRAYRLDVQHFLRTLAIGSAAELRQVDHRAVIAWERFMGESEHAALSSLYKHLVRHGHAEKNPVAEVERPAINRDEGTTLAPRGRWHRGPCGAAPLGACRWGDAAGTAARRGQRRVRRHRDTRVARSATCIRTAAMTRCALSARAAGAMRSPSIRRPRRGSVSYAANLAARFVASIARPTGWGVGSRRLACRP
jgi:hypothetical protein